MDKKRFLSHNGQRLVKQLFIEWANVGENPYAMYTTAKTDKEVDGVVYLSLYRLYMETKDVTEARFVSTYLYDWDQWKSLCNAPFYKDEVARMRYELKNELVGELVDKLFADAVSDSKSSKSSAKFLVEKLSKDKKGRPTTAVLPTTEEKQETVVSAIAHDIKRLHLQ